MFCDGTDLPFLGLKSVGSPRDLDLFHCLNLSLSCLAKLGQFHNDSCHQRWFVATKLAPSLDVKPV